VAAPCTDLNNKFSWYVEIHGAENKMTLSSETLSGEPASCVQMCYWTVLTQKPKNFAMYLNYEPTKAAIQFLLPGTLAEDIYCTFVESDIVVINVKQTSLKEML